ncbi:MAG TPA: hypothetical protein VN455_07615, partial [Methanotrichaceae archaeon]|nr:hypothetical protein [Methanotrichaceae archaeon]
MSSEAELLKAIYEEIKAVNRNLDDLSSRVDLLEMLLIPEEEISRSDSERLDRLSEETRRKGVA